MEINSRSQKQRKFTSRSAMDVLATQEARRAEQQAVFEKQGVKEEHHGYLGVLQ
jgi:hypothetical protein